MEGACQFLKTLCILKTDASLLYDFADRALMGF